MRDPFLTAGRTKLSFSGGRTSGYMLWRTLKAHGGTLPEETRPVFRNTGREKPETLDFIERCAVNWGVQILWLEYDPTAPGNVREVSYATASRNGEPFEALIRRKQHLPNVKQRYCTTWLKIKPSNWWARKVWGWEVEKKKGCVIGGGYANLIGLRYDEPNRLAKLRDALAMHPKHITVETLFGPEKIKNPKWRQPPPPGVRPAVPLAEAKVTQCEVMDFWQKQRGGVPLDEWLVMPKHKRPGWDLELRPDQGNCDLCYLKGPNKLAALVREEPQLADWWIEQERAVGTTARKPDGARFIKNLSFTTIRDAAVKPSGQIPLFVHDDYAPACAYTCTD